MKAPVHISASLFFTGFFCSLWNVNIYAAPINLAVCVIGSLIPDIDNPKSLIGRLFYPLAKFLDRRFGHRTITHSMFFFLGISFVAYMIEIYTNAFDHTLSLILFFSVLSHLIIDMTTVSGVPLFYPFLRNPCVVPGNPAMRFDTRNARSELMCSVVFSLLIFTSYDLVNNGFWTQYNRLFGTVEHVYFEFSDSRNLLNVEYDYIENAERYQGTALLLYANRTDLFLFEKGNILELSTDNKYMNIRSVKAKSSGFDYVENRHIFVNISIDSVNFLLSQNLITGEIQSNYSFIVFQNNINRTVKTANFNRQYSPVLRTTLDTSNVDLQNSLTMKQLRLQQEQTQYYRQIREYNSIHQEIKDNQTALSQAKTKYERNNIESKLIALNRKAESTKKPSPPENLILQQEIRVIEQQMQRGVEMQTFSGYVSFPEIPKQYK